MSLLPLALCRTSLATPFPTNARPLNYSAVGEKHRTTLPAASGDWEPPSPSGLKPAARCLQALSRFSFLFCSSCCCRAASWRVEASPARSEAAGVVLLPGAAVRQGPAHQWRRGRMAAANSLRKLISHVVLDLDGTLLNTDGVVIEIMGTFLAKYGKEWDHKRTQRIVGKTPSEAAAAIVEDYELPCSTEDLLSQVTPLFSEHWKNIKALPGAYRLVRHLANSRIPIALASNSSRSNIEYKISYHNGWKDVFSTIIGVDEVQKQKPSPEIFIQAANQMSVEPSKCLVIEDSVPGVTAGKAAGMKVVAVPSLPKQAHLFTSADEVINSLLDFCPEKWGLPPFQDWIEETLSIEPWFIGGPVIKGFGRGSKLLGIPTANLAAEKFSGMLSAQASGVYFGWAALANKGIYKMVMSVGWNPYFNNVEKTIEPWLLHEFAEDFYGEELRLAIVGYIRPEANFSSLDNLIARIREDGRIAEKALDILPYISYKDIPYLKEIL